MTMFISSLCFVLAVLVSTSESADYCNINTCNPKNSQTLCKFSSSKPASRCGTVQGFLTQSEKNQMLAYHNKQRAYVASGQEKRGKPGPQYAAVSMPNMVWDNELEQVAQRWANQCNYGHDQCRNVDRYKVGQNVGILWSTGSGSSLNPVQILTNMYNEVKDFPRNDVTNVRSNNAVVGHYTQMVWADSVRLGCGGIRYKDGNKNTLYIVCNYGPTGNWVGKGPYKPK